MNWILIQGSKMKYGIPNDGHKSNWGVTPQTAAKVQRQEAVSKSKKENLIVKDKSRDQQRAWKFNLS